MGTLHTDTGIRNPADWGQGWGFPPTGQCPLEKIDPGGIPAGFVLNQLSLRQFLSIFQLPIN